MKCFFKKAVRAGVWILWICLLVSCKQPQSTLLQDVACLPPCWQKIYPDQTTRDEVLTILSKLPEINQKSIETKSVVEANDAIAWQFTAGYGDFGGRITFNSETVTTILIYPKQPFTFSEAVGKYGSPKNVLALYGKGEQTRLSIYLLYPDIGIALLGRLSPFQEGTQAQIREGEAVIAVWYFDPAKFEKIMTDYTIDNLDLSRLHEDLQPWTGFGEIVPTER